MSFKKLNIVEIFLNILIFPLLFVREMFRCYLANSNRSDQLVVNRFTDLDDGKILPIVFIVLIVLNLIFCIIWTRMNRKINFIQIVLPILSGAVFIVIGLLYSAGEYQTLVEKLATLVYEGEAIYSVSYVYIIELIIIFLMSIIAIFKVKKQDNIVEDKAVENFDTIIKYKELLNNGIITQEEFDAKKNQILD